LADGRQARCELTAGCSGAWRLSEDFVVIVLATGVVLTAELFNSAVEGLCDFMETGHDERIGAIKDMAAAAVGVSSLVWLVIVGYEGVQLFGPH
jgi:diacylglycerol kinase